MPPVPLKGAGEVPYGSRRQRKAVYKGSMPFSEDLTSMNVITLLRGGLSAAEFSASVRQHFLAHLNSNTQENNKCFTY